MRRLESFEADPAKHGLHAVKVLIKFRLLETQVESWESLLAWLNRARYFELVRRRYFEHMDRRRLGCARLIDEMCRRRSAQRRRRIYSEMSPEIWD